MKTVIQRVRSAKVEVDSEMVGSIEMGVLIFLGVEHGDTEGELSWLVNKIIDMRIFEDHDGKMNLSLQDIGGSALIVSQFTLLADCSRGRRPAFTDAADPALAEKLYNRFIEEMETSSIPISSGRFGADMQVSLINDGPVTILLNQKPKSAIADQRDSVKKR
ncbi:D-aminoacyl-tRNA deacylase [bacterium]|nr:D-aminoacyl-tRNA deacylase [Rubripirellula sp.]MDB4331654.1 D-aminoacyl-tRNA deacylase [bacterium]MDB4338570.1 D-aminoacyl-tRNA deacylase [Rubripirellula sp.]